MPADLPAVLDLDRMVTGEERSALLTAFAASAWIVEHAQPGARGIAGVPAIAGFHVPCPWGRGPVVATDPAVGRALVDLRRRLHGPRPIGFSIPERNEAALAHLRGYGLEPHRYLTRMWLGDPPPPWRPEMIYGVFNNGLG